MSEFAELLEQSLAGLVMRPGKLIMAQVVEANPDYVLVSAGLKSDAQIPAAEFKNAAGELNVEVGDHVEVALEAVEDGTGNTKMSREKAVHERAWTALTKAQEEDAVVCGTIAGKVKGGFTVDVHGLRAFLPGSLIGMRPLSDPTWAEGRELDFKIIRLDQPRNNIVVSRRAIVENELTEEREKLLDSLEEGQVVEGVVKNLTEYGAFVSLGGLGGLDGLLHITDMAWRRVRHPGEVLKVGDEVTARVLKFDRDKCRVSLGLKQMGEDPWLGLARRYPKNTRLFGRVTNITEYGAFVAIEEGIEGLVHLSEMDWTKKNIHPGRVCEIGDEVEVMVLEIDATRRRISLGMKQCKPNPWEVFAAVHKRGDRVAGNIRSITDFGMFIGLEGGVDGLIHLSDLSWGRRGEEVLTEYQKGDAVRVVVLDVDADRERISLGLKQVTEDPFAMFLGANGKGSAVKGTVKKVTPRGAVLELAPNVDGYLRAVEMSQERVEDAREAVTAGEELEVKIIGVERKERRIALSVRALEIEQQSEAVQNYARASEAEGERRGDSLGEQLKRKLDEAGGGVALGNWAAAEAARDAAEAEEAEAEAAAVQSQATDDAAGGGAEDGAESAEGGAADETVQVQAADDANAAMQVQSAADDSATAGDAVGAPAEAAEASETAAADEVSDAPAAGETEQPPAGN